METTTAFDLNRAIQQWRDNLAASPAIRGENLNELEIHLRDSVANLRSCNLSDDEAFLIATQRVGSNAVLEKEFSKANSQAIWLDRFLWGLIFMQLWNAINSVVVGLSYIYVQVYTYKLTGITNWFAFMTQAGIPVLSALFSVALCFWLAGSQQSRLRKTLENLSHNPLYLAVAISVFALILEEIIPVCRYTILSNIHGSSLFSWQLSFWSLARPILVNFLITGLVFVLARKRLARMA